MNSTKKESEVLFADDRIFELENPKASTKNYARMNENIQENGQLSTFPPPHSQKKKIILNTLGITQEKIQRKKAHSQW